MRTLTAGLALAWTLSAAAAPVTPEPKKDKAAPTGEKIRQALDKTVTLELAGQPLTAAVQKMSEEMGVPLVVDTFTIQQMGLDPNQMMIHFKGKDVKARSALRSVLGQFNLSFAIVGDNILITTDDMAMYRQMRQRVNIDYDGTEFATALKQLARDTATNLIIDARSAKEAKGAVTLRLEDVPLETAVRLMCEMVGLKPVRVGNVMFICSKAAANDLKADTDLVPPTVPTPRVAVEGFPPLGGAVPPAVGIPGAVPPPPPPPPGAAKPDPNAVPPAPPPGENK